LSEEKTENQPAGNANELPSPSNKGALQAFERSLTEAHQSGELYFLAVQLASILREHYEKYGEITASELESLITKAAEEMVSAAK
jgi:hypothetical protein